MIKQIIDLARGFNDNSIRAELTDAEKVAGAFCLLLLILYFVIRDVLMFITAPLWIIPYLIWRKENGGKENNKEG